jgi:hypothetical protein
LPVSVFLGNLTFILLLSIMLHEDAEKRSSMDYLSASSIFIVSGYPHPALSQLRVMPVSASICWEREVLLQVGASGRPHLQAFFPSPASVSQVKSETSRWGGETKGWGLRLCLEIVIN